MFSAFFPSTLFLNAELHVAFLEEKKEAAAMMIYLENFGRASHLRTKFCKGEIMAQYVL